MLKKNFIKLFKLGLKSGLKLGVVMMFSTNLNAKSLQEGEQAPLFSLKTHEGKDFDLSSRKNQWTVLFFYPKAETPGCTKQACAFRDSLSKIRELGADVFGISHNTVIDQEKFHKNHNMNFVLLADEESKVISLYGTKMPLIGMSKRWTFILDPELIIRAIDKNVDPVLDAEHVVNKLKGFQQEDQKKK